MPPVSIDRPRTVGDDQAFGHPDPDYYAAATYEAVSGYCEDIRASWACEDGARWEGGAISMIVDDVAVEVDAVI